MQSWSLLLCVLHFLTLTFTTIPTLATSVSVKLHQTATLPCKRDCPGLVKWMKFRSQDVLAQCDQTSCWSKIGYEMSYDQYLKGDFSLIIPSADYNKRNMYTCKCNDRGIDDVRLIIETLFSSDELILHENMVMDLPIPDPVEVVYKVIDSAGSYGEQICTVTKHTLKCKAGYRNRASLSTSKIILRDVQLSDSGSYTIRDTENNEVIHIYTLIVKEVQISPDEQQRSHWLVWFLLVLIVFIGAGFFLKSWHTKCLERIKQQQEMHLKHENEKCRKTFQQTPRENVSNEKMFVYKVHIIFLQTDEAQNKSDVSMCIK
ncbi:uncharacterized protein LOC128509140 [Clarias gariepinus]|uniref:uncharacterized protein LOC128509140 n=1 Tax=Clarias gariepinus TaxID=13013 RepID=UPI00234C2730|nr:uncharacterized protein LOC128509140 [Clarias gariepinus]XP_053336703.1 uncharacterized protein LOC128509140 [Clarias gariepinus]